MSAQTTGKTTRELVAMARVDGCVDGSMFAEWLCDKHAHFGDPTAMSGPELEAAWTEAHDWWASVTGAGR